MKRNHRSFRRNRGWGGHSALRIAGQAVEGRVATGKERGAGRPQGGTEQGGAAPQMGWASWDCADAACGLELRAGSRGKNLSPCNLKANGLAWGGCEPMSTVPSRCRLTLSTRLQFCLWSANSLSVTKGGVDSSYCTWGNWHRMNK